jgi:hypothetical protein
MPAGDPAEFSDLDAVELAGAEQVVNLVPTDVEQLRDLLDCVRLQVITSSGRGLVGRWLV